MKEKFMILSALFISLIIIPFISGLVIESVSTTPDMIGPGEISSIKIGLENNGDANIEDVSVVLDLKDVPFAPSDSATEFNIDEIKKDRIKYSEFTITALNNAAPGVYKIPIEITYREKDQNTEITKNSLISITVNSEPLISASVEDGLLLNGQENKISIKIVNKGLSNAKFLEIKILQGAFYTILSPDSVYIGDLDSNDFDSAEFNLFFKENAPNSFDVPISVTYKDVLNNPSHEDFNLPVKVYTKQRAIELGLIKQSNTTAYVIAAVVVIILYLIYRRWRKRRKLKKANAENND